MADDQGGLQLIVVTLQNFVRAINTLTEVVTGAVAQYWAALVEVPLDSGASLAPDFSAGFNFSVTLNEDATLENPSNAKPGQHGSIYITQDGVGGRTLAYGSAWQWEEGAVPVLSTAAGALDVLSYKVRSPTLIIGSMAKNISA